MSIEALLKAAAFIEHGDSFVRGSAESEHGYATTLPMPTSALAAEVRAFQKRSKSPRNSLGRTNHNILERNRRAHLKDCLDNLKDMVPLGPEASRHTILGLLTKAKKFIKNLETKERRNYAYKEQLNRQHRYLKQRLEHLQRRRPLCKRRSVSECSSSTSSSGHSAASRSSIPSPVSESDEVDVIGYGSTPSDTDDYSSVRSASSDSGMSMSATLLRFSDMETL